MRQAEGMDELVNDLINQYEADVLPSGLLQLQLTMSGHGILSIEEMSKHRQMRVCYTLFGAAGKPVSEPDMWFYIDPGGHWIPYEIRRISAGHYAYAVLDGAQCKLVLLDAKNQAALAAFADYWAEVLRAQGWLEGAHKCSIAAIRLEPVPFTPQRPAWETLMHWLDENGGCEATDGCWVATWDATCEHGHHSWLVELGLV